MRARMNRVRKSPRHAARGEAMLSGVNEQVVVSMMDRNSVCKYRLTGIDSEPSANHHQPTDKVTQNSRAQACRQHSRAQNQHELFRSWLGVPLDNAFVTRDSIGCAYTVLHRVAQ